MIQSFTLGYEDKKYHHKYLSKIVLTILLLELDCTLLITTLFLGVTTVF